MDATLLEQHSADAAGLLKSMANTSRLMILCSLAGGELSVSALNQNIRLSQSALSQHLAYLRKAGLVATRKDAQSVYYSLQGDEAIRIIEVLKTIYCPEQT